MLDRENPVPLYFQLTARLRKSILAGLQPGGAIPSERELCAQFQVSRITVRKALDELVSQGEVYKIHGKGAFKTRNPANHVRELVYVVYQTAMLTVPGREKTIRALTETAERRGFHLVIKSFNAIAGNGGFCEFACRALHGGLLLSVQELAAAEIARIRQKKIPCVFMHHAADYAVLSDYPEAGALAAGWVRQRNFRRIDLLLPPSRLPDVRAFQQGFIQALPADAAVRTTTVGYDRSQARDAVRRLLAGGALPDAIVAGDDLLAAGAADALAERNLRKKVALSGVNDSYLASELHFPSIDLNAGEHARKAADLLADLLDGNAPPPPCILKIPPQWKEHYP